MKYIYSIALGVLFSTSVYSQEKGLLDELGEDQQTEIVTSTFKSPRVIHSHSVEMLQKGVLDFRILHRFGPVNGGAYEFFGLDAATMRLSFDYGIMNNLTVGVGRSTRNKELDGMLKYKIFSQTTGKKNFPVSIVWTSGMMINTLHDPFGDAIQANFTRRLAFYHELIIGRKFSDKFSAQLTPTLLHRNITVTSVDPNTYYGLGFGARYKVSNRVAIVIDYVHSFNRFPGKLIYDPLAIGVDIETGGHVFQLHFSNAIGMNERSFLTDPNTDWTKGNIMFGFNLSRVFQINH